MPTRKRGIRILQRKASRPAGSPARPQTSLRRFVRRLWNGTNDDRILGRAAEMSFFFVLAFFPLLITLAAVIGMLPFTGLWNSVLAWMMLYLPVQGRHLIFLTVLDVTRQRGSFLSVGILGTLWASTSGMISLISALNRVYKAAESRGYLRRIGLSLLAVLVLSVLLLASFGLLTMGGWMGRRINAEIGIPIFLPALWHLCRWVLPFILATLGIAIIDNFLPNHGLRWRWVSYGAAFTVLAWIAATSLFNFYLAHFGQYQRTYGVLACFIVLMTWVYISSVVILVGAEINHELSTSEPPAAS